jgi:hypothetical protein
MAMLYIDGRRDVSAAVAGPIAANSFNVWIGWDSHRTEWAWNGRIDDVRIYSCALAVTDVRDLYEGREPSRGKH